MILPQTGLSLMPEDDYLLASDALFDSGDVDVIEWSFDMCWGKSIPPRCIDWLTQYSSAGCLLGHGVSFSLLTARRTQRQTLWLEYLKKEVTQFNYQKISEHFGFMSTDTFTQGPPLSMPYIPALLDVGVKNLKEIQQIVKIPLGLENLGFAFSRNDVLEQGKFLSALLDAVDGFLLLDIHNVYCHMMNFNMSAEDVLNSLPLHRLKEIHISGGSFRSIDYGNKQIYCDSHDAAVPPAVFDLLEKYLPRLSGADAIIFERLGNTLFSQYEIDQFQDDFYTLKSIMKQGSYERL